MDFIITTIIISTFIYITKARQTIMSVIRKLNNKFLKKLKINIRFLPNKENVNRNMKKV